MIRPSTTPDHLTAYIEAVRAGHSTPATIRAASGLNERQRINVQRIAQGRGLVAWSSEAGWTVVGEATKRCPRCGVVGPVEGLFGYRTPTGGVRRAQSYCRECRRAPGALNPEKELLMQNRTLALLSGEASKRTPPVAFEWSETRTDTNNDTRMTVQPEGRGWTCRIKSEERDTRATVRLRLGNVEVTDECSNVWHARKGCLCKLAALATALTGEVTPVPDTGWTDDTDFIRSALDLYTRLTA